VQGGSTALNLAFLDSVDLAGTIAIGDLKIKDVKAAKFAASLRAAEGKLVIDGIKADLYGGKLAAALKADSSNVLALDLTLDQVSLEPLLRDLAQEGRLLGQGSVKFKLNSQGQTMAALEAGLSGTVQARIRDGAVKGLNVAQTLREANEVVRNVFSGQLPDVASQFDTARQTDFTSLDADIDFDHGQGTIKKLNLAAPLLRITQGTPASVDLVNDQLDMVMNVRVVNTKTGQNGKDVSELQGVAVPIRVSGPFDKLRYQVQWKEIGSKAVKDAVKGGLIDLLSNQIAKPPESGAPSPGQAAPKKPVDPVKSIGDALKGLLGQ
jgi:AsmA protein